MIASFCKLYTRYTTAVKRALMKACNQEKNAVRIHLYDISNVHTRDTVNICSVVALTLLIIRQQS